MIIPDPFEHYPPGWAAYDKTAGKWLPTRHGFVRLEGDINRFGARYRLASAFQGLQLDGYSSTTVLGYSALTKLFLAWSAFEQYMVICGHRGHERDAFLKKHGEAACIAQIRARDPTYRYIGFIKRKIEKRHLKDQLEAFCVGKPCGVGVLAIAIRHIFAHGSLTPSSNQVATDAASDICHTIADYLLKEIGHDFQVRVTRK